MRAGWLKFDGALQDAMSLVCDGKELLDGEWSADQQVRFTPKGRLERPLSLSLVGLGAPLGEYWDLLYKKEDYSALRDALTKYWAYSGTPKVLIDVVKGTLEESEAKEADYAVIRTKVVAPGRPVDTRLSRIVDSVNSKNLGVDRVVIGHQGDHAELQFLAKRLRQEVKAGDFVDCGLFVSLNGKLQVSAGLNRLVCTNGAVRRMVAWERPEFDFGESYFEQAAHLMEWFKSTADQKVHHVRELSVVLDNFPKPLVSKFWKEWSEAIELGNLTWFQVIDNLTNAVNTTLGDVRYKVLAIGETLNNYEHKCRTCSAKIV